MIFLNLCRPVTCSFVFVIPLLIENMHVFFCKSSIVGARDGYRYFLSLKNIYLDVGTKFLCNKTPKVLIKLFPSPCC